MVEAALIKKYLNQRKTFNDRNYLFSTIACNIAPTLAKIKPSTLVNFSKRGIRDLQKLWETYKQDFMNSTTLEHYEVRKTKNSTLVLFYDPDYLSKVLFQKDNITFLEQFGYSKEMSLHQCLELLEKRFKQFCPHESGILLGIPVEDVISFIQCNGKKYLMLSYWKVYHNQDKAIGTFNSFDIAKYTVLNHITNGTEPFQVINCYNLN